jgi:hypothetical protein
MKNITFLTAAVLVLFIFSGCSKEKKTTPPQSEVNTTTIKTEQSGEIDEMTLKSDTKKEPGLNKLTTPTEKDIDVSKRMVVKSGTLSLEVDNFDISEKRVSEIAKNQNGFIANSTSSVNPSGKKSGTIIIKVPVDKYDILINEISAAGKVASKNITSSDVTEEYIDLESRAKTQKELEQRLLKLLSEKTARLVDIVEVEEKLAAVRQRIESLEGKMKLLTNQASYSTLSVSIYEPAMLQTTSGGGFFYELGQGFKKGLLVMTEILSGLVTIVIALLPVIVFILIIIWIILKIVRRKVKA